MPEYTQTGFRVAAARKARRTRVVWWRVESAGGESGARGGGCGSGDHQASKRGIIGEGEHGRF